MEPVTLLIIIAIALVLIALGWVMARFFFRLLKHFIIAVVLGAILMCGWYYLFIRVPRDPHIGKRAYVVGTDQYVGEVVGSSQDEKLGDIWIVKSPSGYPMKYRKSRLTLKDK
jgi:hypothetical protein